MRSLLHSLLLVLAVLAVSCGKHIPTETVPGEIEMMSAATCVFNLKQQGKLPGISKDAHGTLESVPVPMPGSDDADQIGRATIQMKLADQPDTTFSYLVITNGQKPGWHLVEAWKTDKSGTRDDLRLAP